MLEKIYIAKPNHTDLNMYRCGIEDCTPGHSWGPAVRDHFLIHYILNGKGSFQVNGTIYRLEKGNGFLITPNIATSYQADFYEPWTYSWVGFHGLKAEAYLRQAGLTAENPIFKYDRDDFVKKCFSSMLAVKDLTKTREIQMLGYLYLFLGHMIETADNNDSTQKHEDRKELYIRKAIEFIQMNYFSTISISEMAHHIGLDRSYVYSLFKEYLNTSPQEFLINFRVNKACELMGNKALSIGDVSRSVGYEDPLLFSKVFKKIKGVSPREFRKCSVK